MASDRVRGVLSGMFSRRELQEINDSLQQISKQLEELNATAYRLSRFTTNAIAIDIYKLFNERRSKER